MSLILAAALSLAAAPQTQDHSAHQAPVPTPAAVAAPLTIDTPIETIAASPAGKAALEAAIPGITAHPAYDQFKGMSLVQVQPMSGGALTDEQIAKVKEGLAAIK
jgi:hypothetical protein